MRAALTPLGRQHVTAVAALHQHALGGLLTRLGRDAIASLYLGYLASPRCTAFVAEADGVVRGFVLGSAEPEAMRRDALRSNLPGIARGVACGVLRQPGLARHVLGGFGGLPGSFDPRTPELTYIAVGDDARGAGVGSELLRTFDASLRRCGITHYELSVEASNHAALKFYEARGFRRTSSYLQFDTTYHRYAFDVPLEKATEARSFDQ
jgi:ribosomal protein S18 acetylase RimI-like enzyme